jgi:tetratricopeptide (TPR) repeat protein
MPTRAPHTAPARPVATPRLQRALSECAAGAKALHAGRTEDGLRRYVAAIAMVPTSADVAALYGVALRFAGRLQDAQRELIRAISLDPQRADSYTQLAQTYVTVKDHAQAANAFLAAATLLDTNAIAWRDAAEALRLSHRLPDGLAIARRAAALAPDEPSIANTLALLLHRNDLIDEALAVCERVYTIAPDDRNLSLTYAMLLRTVGRYAQGWALHERRLELPELTQRPFPPGTPRWDGTPLAGRHLLVRGEQGMGDQVQFARWCMNLQQSHGAGRVTLQCAAPLVRLLTTLAGVDEIVPATGAAPAHDLHVDIMSLPHLLGSGNDMRPSVVPYLTAPSDNVALAAQLAPRRAGTLRIGFVWAGTPLHTEDRSRSAPLSVLLPAVLRRNVELVILQQGSGRDQLDALDPGFRATLLDVADRCLDLADTAQAITACDLVLTVDTSVAHVAGALGVPTWVMVACPAEWRWGRERTDSMFYPSVRLFRQARVGDWSAVVTALDQAISARIGAPA